MTDTISRQAVEDLIMETDPFWCEGMTRAIFEGVKRLPTIEPKREYSIDLEAFAEWVAKQVCREDFDEDGTFAEMACRRLWKLGFVRMNGDEWEYGEE